jgi:adenine-specific DNA-methyltransferase
MEFNAEYDVNAHFVLVQLPESIAKDEPAYQAGFKKISDITIERNKRVIEGYGKDPKPIDTGFKVYRLTKSNFPRAEFVPDPDKSEEENVKALEQYIAEKESSFQMTLDGDTILDEVLLKHGFPLDYAASKQEQFSNNTVYLAEHGGRRAYVCLDPSLDDDTIDYFKKNTDTTLICLERALDTTKKWNLNHSLGERLKAL